MIRPVIGAELLPMTTRIATAINQHAVNAFIAQFAERYFLRALDHDKSSLARFIAGEFGFLTLIQCLLSPAR